MPELPEVETVRRGLERHVLGRKVLRVEVHGPRTVRRHDAKQLVDALEGRRITGVRRYGKFLVVDLEADKTLVIHLRMSGKLRYAPGGTEDHEPHTHAVITFDGGDELRFIDPRTFGELFISAGTNEAGRPVELGSLGLDPYLEKVTVEKLEDLVTARRISLKAFLLDQAALAGIGNIYGDEICFAARLLPTRLVAGLTRRELASLAKAIDQVLNQAVASGGSSLRDASYRDIDGNLGSYQMKHAVYKRTGDKCPRCASAVESGTVRGRSAHWCPSCQM